MRLRLTFQSILCLLSLCCYPPFLPAQQVPEVSIFGPLTFTRTAGQPNVFDYSIIMPAGITAPFTLRVQNGNADGTQRVTSASILVNGVEAVSESDLKQKSSLIQKHIALPMTEPSNIRISLRSAPRSFIVLLIAGVPSLPTLPPDPGGAGTLTLAGIDSDGDGVRDDLQRYIALTYRDSPPTQAALAHFVKGLQASLLQADDKVASLRNWAVLRRAIECLHFVAPSRAQVVANSLLAEALNTRLRSYAYIAFSQQLGGEVFAATPLSALKTMCVSGTDAFAR